MNHAEIATCAGILPADLDSLVSGQASANLARAVGVTIADIEDFIKGSASRAMAIRLGFSAASAADELAKTLGPTGAIGLIIGLLLGDRK